MQSSHQLHTSNTSDSGCGRYQTQHRNIILLHDTTVSTLFGPDMEKIKSLCRGENTVVKVHSSTSTVPAVFVLVTSNERLQNHHCPTSKTSTQWLHILPSHVEKVGRKRIHEEHIKAVQNRFIEMHIRKKCHQDEIDLRRSDSFEKKHMVLGLYDRILTIMEMYTPDDFCSAYLYRYVIGGLEKNAQLYQQEFETDRHIVQLLNLSCKYHLLNL